MLKNMDSSLLISLIFLGLFIGFLASMLGASGGIMFVPAFLSIFHLDPRIAIGTSIFCSLILSSSSSIGYISSKNVNWKISLIYLIGGIPATLTGAWLSTKISNLILTVICGASLAMMSMILILKKQKEEFKKEMSLRMKNKYLSSQSFEEFNYFEHKNISKEYNKNKTEHFRQWQENCPLAMNFENLLMTKLNDEKGSTHKNSVWQKKKIILMILIIILTII